MFDDAAGVCAAPAGVGLLNPGFRSDDPAARRFAQLEVDER